jgi:hypothetical protein
MKKIILALACCATIVSCQKKEDTDPIDVSKTTYLKDKTWKLTFFTWLPDINDPASFPFDSFTVMLGCQKDNYFKFNAGNRVTRYDGNSKCSQTDPDSVVYGYALTDNDTHLRIYAEPDIPEPPTYLAGTITYPAIDSFVLTYTAPHPQDSSKTSRYVRAYVKQ